MVRIEGQGEIICILAIVGWFNTKHINNSNTQAERRRWERKAAWKLSKGMSESSSTAHFSNHMSNNTSGKFNLTNSSATLHSLHNLDHNYLNHHPSAKYFSSMPKKSR